MGIIVIVVDKDHLSAAGLGALLDIDPDISAVPKILDTHDAESIVADTGCSVAIVHHQPPLIDSIRVTAQLVDAFGAALAVLILTEKSDDPGFAKALRVGARGYLTRAAAVPLLRLAVHGLAAGGLVLESGAADEVLTAWPVPAGGDVDTAGVLTLRERTVFELLAEGLSNAEIAAELSVAVSTVKKHVSSVLRKLGLRDRQHVAVIGNRPGGLP